MRWWLKIRRRRQLDRDLREELDFHQAMRARDREQSKIGLPLFGNETHVREEMRDMWTFVSIETAWRDAGHAFRGLRRNPTFAVIAILTLGIGIGANTAVFSVVNSVLLKPLPYPDAGELISVRHIAPGAPGIAVVAGGLGVFSPTMYFTYAEQNRTFQALGVWNRGTAAVTGLAEPEQVRTVSVSDGVLEALGVSPVLGRLLGPSDQKPGGPETVLLSYGYWQRRFGGDRSVAGRNITVDSRLREIVGVMPEGFRIVDTESDLIVPFAFDRGQALLPGYPFPCVARLKPGVSIQQASADLARLVPIWMSSWRAARGINPKAWVSWRITPALRPLKQDVVGNLGEILWVVMATIGVVMVIVCANVANLMLVRAEARQQELAIRTALGCARGRLVRAVLLESVLLGLLGGVAGVGFAYVGLRLLVSHGPANLPRLHEISIDARTLAFTLVLAAFSGLVAGLIPVWKAAGPRISLALRAAGRTLSVTRERHRARNILVVAQIAMSLVLLVCAGLMIRTFQALRTVEPGFTHPGQLQTLRISLPPSFARNPQQVTRTLNDIDDKLAAIPGVRSAGFGSEMPMEGLDQNVAVIYPEGKVYARDVTPPLRLFKFISPGFLQTTGTRLLAGREFTWTDVYGGRPVALVSGNLAREVWGAPSAALGKRFTQAPGGPWEEVIGVVQDVYENGVQEKAPATVYRSDSIPTVTFVIHTERAGTKSFLDQVREAVWSVDPNLPLASVRTMQDIYDQSLARTSFTLAMLAIAGAMALLLGIIGIYGAMSYTVSQRRREIGIRLALGAEPGVVRRMVLRQGLVLAGSGVAIGLAIAGGLMQLMKSLLYGISTLDLPTYATVPILLLLAAGIASYVPARRASTVDPVQVLRQE